MSSTYTPPVTHKHTPWKRTQCIQTLMRTDFLQQTVACSRLYMTKWIRLINHSRNSITLCVALFHFLLQDTLPPSSTSSHSTIIIYSPCSTLHLSSPLLHQSSSSSLFPLFSSASRPPSLVSDLKHTPRQTLEKSDGPDQTYVLNYNPSE